MGRQQSVETGSYRPNAAAGERQLPASSGHWFCCRYLEPLRLTEAEVGAFCRAHAFYKSCKVRVVLRLGSVTVVLASTRLLKQTLGK